MLDIKFIRENKDIVAAGARKKHIDIDLDRLIELDDKRKDLQQQFDAKRAEQHSASEKISTAAPPDKQAMIESMTAVKQAVQALEAEIAEILKEWRNLMVRVPNVPDISVPDGASDADNKEVKTWGEIPKFSFEPKSAAELLTMHDMVDTERGAKVAGFRGYFLKNDGARLVWALERFVIDRFANREGFQPIIVPSMVRREPFVGTGYLPQSEDDIYKTQDGDYLAGTAEVATMGYFMDEVIEK
ncbi:MAG: serine--tRNA ligase, partial [Minisyncoccia bacterium]